SPLNRHSGGLQGGRPLESTTTDDLPPRDGPADGPTFPNVRKSSRGGLQGGRPPLNRHSGGLQGGRPPLNQYSPLPDLVEHVPGQFAGEGVLLAGVIGAQQDRTFRDRDLGPVTEAGTGTGHLPSPSGPGTQHPIPGQTPE